MATIAGDITLGGIGDDAIDLCLHRGDVEGELVKRDTENAMPYLLCRRKTGFGGSVKARLHRFCLFGEVMPNPGTESYTRDILAVSYAECYVSCALLIEVVENDDRIRPMRNKLFKSDCIRKLLHKFFFEAHRHLLSG